MRAEVSTRKVQEKSRTHLIEVKLNDSGYYLALTQLGPRGERVRIAVSSEHADEYARAVADASRQIQDLTDRLQSQRSYQPWSASEDDQLRQEIASGKSTKEIAASHGRKLGAIQSRISKLGLG